MTPMDELILTYLNDEASEAEVERLFAWVNEKPEHANEFAKAALLHSHLRGQLAGESDLQDRVDAQEMIGSPVKASRGERANQSRLLTTYYFFARPTPLSMTVATVVIGLLLTVMAFTVPPFYRHLTSDSDTPATVEFVAQLTGTDEAVWTDGQLGTSYGSHWHAGERKELLAGQAEVTFRSGVVMIVEGPASFELVSRNAGHLNAGSLTVRVPESAQGFTISTPLASVIDLGTEFGMRVQENGAADVTVLTGTVEVLSHPSAGEPGPRVRLTAGQTASVSARDGRIALGAPADESILAALQLRLDSMGARRLKKPIRKPFVAFHDLGGEPSPGHITTQRSLAETIRLVNLTDGAATGVKFTIEGATRVDMRSEGEGRPPNPGTPAAELFVASGIDLDDGFTNVDFRPMTFTFTGLSNEFVYDIALYGDRSRDANGPEQFILEGAKEMTNRSTTGVVDQATTQLDTRSNAEVGHVVRWTDVDPGSDGEVTIVISPTEKQIAYLSAIRVACKSREPSDTRFNPQPATSER